MKNIFSFNTHIAEAIDHFLTEDDWHYEFDKEQGIFQFNLSIKNTLKKLQYQIHVGSDDFIVYATSPIGADQDNAEMIAKMAEFVCRANSVLRCGCFTYDHRDGELGFKVYVDCDGISSPSEEMIKNSIYCPAHMFNRYGGGILDIIFHNADAKEAVLQCEKQTAESIKSILDSFSDCEDDYEGISELLAEAKKILGIAGTDDTDSERSDTDEESIMESQEAETE